MQEIEVMGSFDYNLNVSTGLDILEMISHVISDNNPQNVPLLNWKDIEMVSSNSLYYTMKFGSNNNL